MRFNYTSVMAAQLSQAVAGELFIVQAEGFEGCVCARIRHGKGAGSPTEQEAERKAERAVRQVFCMLFPQAQAELATLYAGIDVVVVGHDQSAAPTVVGQVATLPASTPIRLVEQVAAVPLRDRVKPRVRMATEVAFGTGGAQ